MKYTFAFHGEITVEAKTEEEAYEKADNLLGITAYAADHCINCSVSEINLIDEVEE